MLHFIRIGVDRLHFRADKADGNALDSKLKVSLIIKQALLFLSIHVNMCWRLYKGDKNAEGLQWTSIL